MPAKFKVARVLGAVQLLLVRWFMFDLNQGGFWFAWMLFRSGSGLGGELMHSWDVAGRKQLGRAGRGTLCRLLPG